MEKLKEQKKPDQEEKEESEVQFSDAKGLVWMMCGFVGLLAAIVIAAVMRH